ncbi:MAG: hypothetical protein MI757_19165, partial [Pirellulales bacterium]|nr:hypothetical protein [Pirellulales bacterium]
MQQIMQGTYSTIPKAVATAAVTLLVASYALALPKADPKKLVERDQALKEADRKAFEVNMAMYDRDVKPFLAKHCTSCHNPKDLDGDLAIDLLDPDMKESTSGSRWAVVRDKLETGEMPPEDEPQPTADEKANVLAWIKAEMKRARRNFTRRQQVVHGNRVPHDLLFDPERS